VVQIVALAMTIWGVAEAWHLTSAFELPGNEFWGVFGFTASIIIAGYIMEINFVAKTNQFTQLQRKLHQTRLLASTDQYDLFLSEDEQLAREAQRKARERGAPVPEEDHPSGSRRDSDEDLASAKKPAGFTPGPEDALDLIGQMVTLPYLGKKTLEGA